MFRVWGVGFARLPADTVAESWDPWTEGLPADMVAESWYPWTEGATEGSRVRVGQVFSV